MQSKEKYGILNYPIENYCDSIYIKKHIYSETSLLGSQKVHEAFIHDCCL